MFIPVYVCGFLMLYFPLASPGQTQRGIGHIFPHRLTGKRKIFYKNKCLYFNIYKNIVEDRLIFQF